MSSFAVGVAGYAVVLGLLCVLSIVAWRRPQRVVPASRVAATLLTRRAGRMAVVLVWWWWGWHTFVR